jgi:hypothetical protein
MLFYVQGLIPAVKKLFPESEHRFCVTVLQLSRKVQGGDTEEPIMGMCKVIFNSTEIWTG